MANNQTGTGKRISDLTQITTEQFDNKKTSSYFLLLCQNESNNNNENYKVSFDTLYDNFTKADQEYATIEQLDSIHENHSEFTSTVYGETFPLSNITIMAGSTSGTYEATKYLDFGDSFVVPANMHYNSSGHLSEAANLTLKLPQAPEKMQLGSDYKMSSLSNDDLQLMPGDSFTDAFSKLHKALIDDEKVMSFALNDLNARINRITNDLSEYEDRKDLLSEDYNSIYIDPVLPLPLPLDEYSLAIKKLHVYIEELKNRVDAIVDSEYEVDEEFKQEVYKAISKEIKSINQSISDNHMNDIRYLDEMMSNFRQNINTQLNNWMQRYVDDEGKAVILEELGKIKDEITDSLKEGIGISRIDAIEAILQTLIDGDATGSTSSSSIGHRLTLIEQRQEYINEKLNDIISVLSAKADISTIPSKTSELENNSDYVTSAETTPAINEITDNVEGIEGSRIDQLENSIHELESIIEELLNNQ